MQWTASNRADPFARDIADRHYNRQKIGTTQFVPPGRCLVLTAEKEAGRALWITSWPFAAYVKHAWAGAWMCSAFRNEGAGVASELILDAISATRFFFGEPPLRGMVTFLDRKKVKPTMRRGRETWGYTWEKAGFEHVGFTGKGLMAFRLPLDRFPEAVPATGGGARHCHWRSESDFLAEARILAAA